MVLVKVPEWNLTGFNWPGLDSCLHMSQPLWPGPGIKMPMPESDGLEVEKKQWSLTEESAAYTITSACEVLLTVFIEKIHGWGRGVPQEGADWGSITFLPLVCSVTLDNSISPSGSVSLVVQWLLIIMPCKIILKSTCNSVIYKCN